MMDSRTNLHFEGAQKLHNESSLEADNVSSDYTGVVQNYSVLVLTSPSVRVACQQLAPLSTNMGVSPKTESDLSDQKGSIKVREVALASIVLSRCPSWVSATSSRILENTRSSPQSWTGYWNRAINVGSCFHTSKAATDISEMPLPYNGKIHRGLESPIIATRERALMTLAATTRELRKRTSPIVHRQTSASNSAISLLKESPWSAGERLRRTNLSQEQPHGITLKHAGNTGGVECKLIASTQELKKVSALEEFSGSAGSEYTSGSNPTHIARIRGTGLTHSRNMATSCSIRSSLKQMKDYLEPSKHYPTMSNCMITRNANYSRKSSKTDVQENMNEHHVETKPVQFYVCKSAELNTEPCCRCVGKNPGGCGEKGQPRPTLFSAVKYQASASTPNVKDKLSAGHENSASGSEWTAGSVEHSSTREPATLFGCFGAPCLNCGKGSRTVPVRRPLIAGHRPPQLISLKFGQQTSHRTLNATPSSLLAPASRGSVTRLVEQVGVNFPSKTEIQSIGQRCPCTREACHPEQSDWVGWYSTLKTCGQNGHLSTGPGHSARGFSNLQQMTLSERKSLNTFPVDPTKVDSCASEKAVDMEGTRKCDARRPNVENMGELHDFVCREHHETGRTVSHDDVDMLTKVEIHSTTESKSSKFFSNLSDLERANEPGRPASLMRDHGTQCEGGSMRDIGTETINGCELTVGVDHEPPKHASLNVLETESTEANVLESERPNYTVEIGISQMSLAAVKRPSICITHEARSPRPSTIDEGQAVCRADEYNGNEESMYLIGTTSKIQQHKAGVPCTGLIVSDKVNVVPQREALYQRVSGFPQECSEDRTTSSSVNRLGISVTDSSAATDRIGVGMYDLETACSPSTGSEKSAKNLEQSESVSDKTIFPQGSEQIQLHDRSRHSAHIDMEGKRVLNHQSVVQNKEVQFRLSLRTSTKRRSTVEKANVPTSPEVVLVELEDRHLELSTAAEQHNTKFVEVSEPTGYQLRNERCDTKGTETNGTRENNAGAGKVIRSTSGQECAQETSSLDGEYELLAETRNFRTSDHSVAKNFSSEVEHRVTQSGATIRQLQLNTFPEEHTVPIEEPTFVESLLAAGSQVRSNESHKVMSASHESPQNGINQLDELTTVCLDNCTVSSDNRLKQAGSSKDKTASSQFRSPTARGKMTSSGVQRSRVKTNDVDMRFDVSEGQKDKKGSMLSNTVSNGPSSLDGNSRGNITSFSEQQTLNPSTVAEEATQKTEVRRVSQETEVHQPTSTVQKSFVPRCVSDDTRKSCGYERISLNAELFEDDEEELIVRGPSGKAPGQQVAETIRKKENLSDSTEDRTSLYAQQIFSDHRVTYPHKSGTNGRENIEARALSLALKGNPGEESTGKPEFAVNSLMVLKMRSSELECIRVDQPERDMSQQESSVINYGREHFEYLECPESLRRDDRPENVIVHLDDEIPQDTFRNVPLRCNADENWVAERKQVTTDVANTRPKNGYIPPGKVSRAYPAARCNCKHTVCPRCGHAFLLRPSLVYRSVWGCLFRPRLLRTHPKAPQQSSQAQSGEIPVVTQPEGEPESVSPTACKPTTKSNLVPHKGLQQRPFEHAQKCCCSPTPELIICSPEVSVNSRCITHKHLPCMCSPQANRSTISRLVYLHPIMRRNRVKKKCTCKKRPPR